VNCGDRHTLLLGPSMMIVHVKERCSGMVMNGQEDGWIMRWVCDKGETINVSCVCGAEVT
jgi:hypothetical protein